MQSAAIVLFCLVVVAALEGLFHLLRYLSERRAAELKRRLRLLGDGVNAELGLLRRERYASSPGLEALVRALPGSRGLERLIAQADASMSVAQLLTTSALAAAFAVGVPLTLGLGLAPALGLGLLAALVPTGLVHSARSRRSERMSEQLPEALDMMSRSLRAGHALPSAFRLVASEMPTPVSVEFGRAYEEQRLGLPAEQAVVNITGRCPLNPDLKIFAVSVVVQKETGGNLAEILEKIATTIRDRFRFYSKLKALTAEGRMSGFVLGSLPLAMGLFLAIVNPSYLGRLFNDPIGQLVFLYGLLSWAVGGMWMYRMSKVDF